MSSYEFEGFTKDINQSLYEFISKVLTEQKCNDNKVIVEAVGAIGENYGSDVRRFIAKKDGKILKMVAKMDTRKRQPTNGSNMAFHNEITMYKEVLPTVTKLEEIAGIPEEERLKYAKYYGSLVDQFGEIILLEDLQNSGFILVDRRTSLTDEAMKLVLKNLAKLHSASFVIKVRKPETFNLFKDKLVRLWEGMLDEDNCLTHFQNLEDDVLQVVSELKYVNQLKGRMGRLPALINEAQLRDNSSGYGIILHGDCWTNNIMFKLLNRVPISCCLIDYQVSRVASPASDILYTIFNCTDHITRMKNYNEWINYYHKALEKDLLYHGLKLESVYPKERFHADLKSYGEISIAQAVVCATTTVREGEDCEKVKQAICHDSGNFVANMTAAMKVTPLGSETKMKFKTRVEDIVNSHLELGLL